MCTKFDEKNSLSNDNVISDDQIFLLKNVYLSKEAQIINIQFLLNTFLERRDEFYFEYLDIEGKTVTNCMDHFMVGIRNEMAKTTRLLNIQQNKSIELSKSIEDKRKEIEELKNQKSNTNNTTLVTPDLSTHVSSKSPNEKTEKTDRKKKKKKVKKEDKIQMIKDLQLELKVDYETIESFNNEIDKLKTENHDLQLQGSNSNLELSNKLSSIYALEMQLDKLKAKMTNANPTINTTVTVASTSKSSKLRTLEK